MAKQPEQLPGAESSADGGVDSSAKKSSLLSKLLFLPLVLGPFAGGAYLAYAKYSQLSAATTAVSSVFGTKDAPGEDAPIEYGQFHELSGIVINPQDSGGTRFLMVSVGLESQSGATLEEIKGKEIVVRDIVLKLLGERAISELSDIALRTQLKDELRTAINGVVKEGRIDRLYFTQYVLQ